MGRPDGKTQSKEAALGGNVDSSFDAYLLVNLLQEVDLILQGIDLPF